MLAPSLGLTAREADVAALISAGVDIGEAARRLGLAPGTARNYLKNAMRKLDVHSQVELAALVAELSNLAIA
jgi:DNA-binding CsgD family transcriptional regulator